MPKYLLAASYTPEGFRGLAKDTASGRQKAVHEAIVAVGGKLESLHFALGDADVYVVADFPDNLTAAKLAVAVCSTGLVRTKTIPLFTAEEADGFFSKPVPYRAPGT